MHCCKLMRRYINKREVPIEYNAKFREYGIRVLDGGTSKIIIDYCPWCGNKLPDSLRSKWFEIINQFGLEPGSSKIQKQYLSELWWRKLKL